MTVFNKKEINEANAKPAGLYDFTTTEVATKLSKKAEAEGQMEPNMFVVKHRCFNPDGEGTFYITDYLLFNDVRFASKVRGYCQSIGLEYNDDTLAHEDRFEGRSGRLELAIDKEGRNTVKKYIAAAQPGDSDLDDAINF